MDHVDQPIALVEVDGDDAGPVDVAVVLQRGALDATLRRGEQQVVLGPLEVIDVQERDDPFIVPQLQ